jgi:hypothetical protein
MGRCVGVVGALLTLALAVSSTAHARASGGVRVIHGTNVVWTFHTGACTRTKHRFTAVLGGETKNPDYAMAISIDGFTGFHNYPVKLGPSLGSGSVFLKLFGPGDAAYSNFYKPSFPVPGAGLVTFGSGGKLMGVGFGPAMWTRDGSDAVVLAGGVKCKYKKKKKK